MSTQPVIPALHDLATIINSAQQSNLIVLLDDSEVYLQRHEVRDGTIQIQTDDGLESISEVVGAKEHGYVVVNKQGEQIVMGFSPRPQLMPITRMLASINNMPAAPQFQRTELAVTILSHMAHTNQIVNDLSDAMAAVFTDDSQGALVVRVDRKLSSPWHAKDLMDAASSIGGKDLQIHWQDSIEEAIAEAQSAAAGEGSAQAQG